MFKFLCAMDQAEYQYWMPMIFGPSGGTEALPEITVCENSLPCKLKLYDANKKPYTKTIQKCGHLLFWDF